jgi:PAS domain S-box-containing protein
MSASEYSFIDIAVLDDVRGRFAAGDALAILSSDLEEVIWANGPGARMFGYPDIEAIMGAAAGLGLAQKRQIAASPGYPDIGADRALLLRLATGHSSRAVSLLASAIRLPDGERAIMLAAPAAAAGARDPSEIAARAISGFTEAGYYAAYLRAGRIVASAPGYEELGIATATVDAMVADVADAPDRLVKRRIAAANGRIPAGIARLSDDPAVHLLVVVDDPEFYRSSDFPEETPIRQPDRSAPEELAVPKAGSVEATPAPERSEDSPPRREDAPASTVENRPAETNAEGPAPAGALAGDGPQRSPIDRWYFEADTPSVPGEPAASPAQTATDADGPDLHPRMDEAQPADEPADDAGAATGPDEDLPAAAEPAEAVQPPQPVQSTEPPFTRTATPVRFAWRTDAEGRFSAMSREFLAAVGASETAVIGRSFADLAGELGIDPNGDIAGLLARRDTWSGKTVLWPLAATGWRTPVDLAALPVYARDRLFEGFRGFGIARPADAIFVPAAVPDPVALADGNRNEPEDETPGADDATGISRVSDGHETPPPAAPGEGASETTDVAPPPQEVSGGPDATGTTVIPLDEARSRRFSDKIIRLAEHRPPTAERNLSPGERNAFREIGDRLKKVTEPREEAPESASPKGTAETIGSAADAAGEETAAPAAGTPAIVAPEPEANTPPLPQEPVRVEEPLRPEETARFEQPSLPDRTTDETVLPRPSNPFFIEVEEELSEEPIAPEAAPAAPVQAETPGGDRSGAEAPHGDGAQPEKEAATARDAAIAADDRQHDASPPMAVQPPAALGSIEQDVRPAADNENGHAARSVASGASSDEPALEAAPTGESLPPAAAGAADAFPESGAGHAVLARLPLPMLVHAGDVLHFANQSFLDFTGYATLAELENAGGLGALFAEQGAASGPSDAPAHAALLRRRDGSTIPVRAHLQSIAWGRGKALLLALRPADQPQDETVDRPGSDLADRVEEMRTILDTATDGVVVIAPDGTIRSINRPAEALFGYDDSEVAGKPFAALLAVESQRAAREYLQGLSDNGVASVLNDGREVIGREAQGRFIPLFMTIGRLPGGNGFCAVLRDITSWKRAEEELTKARTLAERASSQKSEFLARVSHEIRTPLNAIIGFSELMMDEKFGPIGNERYRDYLRDINRSGNLVLDIVNDLLDISKIEAGEQEMAYEAVSLNDVLAETVAMMQPQANRERVIIRSSFASRLPEVVADLRSVRQIGLNLLSNAVRFTQPGGQVIVSTAYEASGDVVMRVRDTGIGMSSAEIEQALKPFKQINSLKRTRNDGTGLGLPLTKAMVEANRARFTINSAPGEGTLVEICFPSTRVLAD